MYSHLGRYEIIEELGRGAMGIVYKAKDPLIERLVAIKAIDLKSLTTKERSEYEARFYQEVQAAGHLNHPNIVTIHDVGESGDVAYIAMELLEGSELQNLIKGQTQLSIDEILDIAIQTATGLSIAHQNGIVHRDIKPSNIMVLKDGRVKIVDFGIARNNASLLCTLNGMIIGSPLYMSPEQVLNHPIDSRSDIFSLGIVLYQMLTGVLPFSGENHNSVMYQIVNETPLKPSSLNSDIPDMLDPIVARCLEKSPLERYPYADELADDLRACRGKLANAKTALESLRHFNKSGKKTIHQLIYESRPTSEFTESALVDILTKSQFKNIRLDLSGLLVFNSGKFMQLLEGREKDVKELFEVIQHDPRHTDVKIVLETDSANRSMPSWVMGFSTGGHKDDDISAKSFFIPPDVTRQICESMEGEIGQKFLQFIEG